MTNIGKWDKMSVVCIIVKDGSKNIIAGDQLRFGEDGNMYVMNGEVCTGFFRVEEISQAYVKQRK